MTAVADGPRTASVPRRARHRYGLIFLVILVLVVFVLAAPSEGWARAVAIVLQVIALVTVVATSRDRESIRRRRAAAVAVGGAALAVLVGTGALPAEAAFAISAVLSAGIAVALILGAVRLVAARGITVEAVAAGLSIYLLIGLLFAYVVAFTAEVGPAPYFAAGQPIGGGAGVYFSFTVLTTTGFCDYVPATNAGRAIAVVEMLLGQLYLVTVVGVLVGGVVGRGRRAEAGG
jgi:ion channel